MCAGVAERERERGRERERERGREREGHFHTIYPIRMQPWSDIQIAFLVAVAKYLI